MEEWAEDPTPVLSGQGHAIFSEVELKRDDVFNKLVAPTDSDEDTKTLLKKIFTGFKDVYTRQLADQLPGGEHYQPSSDLIKQGASCQSTNISGERVFGQLDFQLKRAPNLKVDFAESKIMYPANDTATWLDQKSVTEHDSIISAARKSASEALSLSQTRHRDILAEKSRLLREKQEQKAKKEEKQRENKENILLEMNEYGGLWTTEATMDSELAKLQNYRQRMLAVKSQLRVRKSILQQKADKELLMFSSNRKAYTLAQLKKNLTKLFEGNEDDDTSQMNKVLKNPAVLEFKYIRHLWEPEPARDKWYDGYIHHMVVGDDGIIEYKIEYYSPPEEVFLSFDELVADLRAGDLIILWDK